MCWIFWSELLIKKYVNKAKVGSGSVEPSQCSAFSSPQSPLTEARFHLELKRVSSEVNEAGPAVCQPVEQWWLKGWGSTSAGLFEHYKFEVKTAANVGNH